MNIDELANSLKRAEQTLIKLIEVSDQVTPKIKKDVIEITERIEGGFNVEKIRKQAKEAIDSGVEASTLRTVEAEMKNTGKSLLAAVENTKENLKIMTALSSKRLNFGLLAIGCFISFVIGSLLVFSWQYNRIDRYQRAIASANSMASFINLSCAMKKAYGTYTGQTLKDCNQTWKNASEYE